MFTRLWQRAYHRPLRITQSLAPLKITSEIPAIRFCNEEGKQLTELPKELTEKPALQRIFRQMLQLQAMDAILYDAQRQGRISFYMTSSGEEAAHFGSAEALLKDDPVFAQYRETGVLIARGFPLQQMLHQVCGNHMDWGKGRQMPIHYGSRAHQIHTISSPLGTQLPQAVGSAYRLKLEGSPNLPICYFGEGAASEGDFHAALNMASTLKTPIIFFCRNNEFAISTPDTEQYAGDGIAARGPAYGIPTFRVDGNDLWAVFAVTREARRLAKSDATPVLIEAMTYRVGHHSTSDDSSAYRQLNRRAIEANCPVARVQRFMTAKGLLNAAEEAEWRESSRQQVIKALEAAEKLQKPAISEMFTDVYDELTPALKEQHAELLAHLAKYPEAYDQSKFK